MKEITYLDTFGDGGYTYEDFVEYCKEQNWDMQEGELEIPAEYSASYCEWVREQLYDDVDCFFENLKYAKGVVKEPCTVTGTLGLWWGHPDVEPVECEDLATAIRKCWGGCDYVRVTLEDGVVNVRATHHDGTNYFEIRPSDGSVYPEYLY